LEHNTLLFDVGAEFWAVDDEVAVDDVRDADVVSEVDLGVTPTDGADLAVGLVDDCVRDVVAVDDPEAAV
jgi:hypothetical protein